MEWKFEVKLIELGERGVRNNVSVYSSECDYSIVVWV